MLEPRTHINTLTNRLPKEVKSASRHLNRIFPLIHITCSCVYVSFPGYKIPVQGEKGNEGKLTPTAVTISGLIPPMVSRKKSGGSGGGERTKLTRQAVREQLSFLRYVDVSIAIVDEAPNGFGYFDDAQSQRRLAEVTAGRELRTNMNIAHAPELNSQMGTLVYNQRESRQKKRRHRMYIIER